MNTIARTVHYNQIPNTDVTFKIPSRKRKRKKSINMDL